MHLVRSKVVAMVVGGLLLSGCASTPMKDLQPSEVIPQTTNKYENMERPDGLVSWEKGMWYYKHHYYKEALPLLEPYKEKNIADVEHAYGYMNDQFKQDYKAAAMWYQKAIEHGNHATSMNNLAILYSNGLGVKQSNSKFIDLLTRFAQGGYVPAQFTLAKAYYIGDKVSQDYGKAYYWLQQAYYNGHIRAPYTIGFMYEQGDGFEQNNEKALYWYTEASKRGCEFGVDAVARLKYRLSREEE